MFKLVFFHFHDIIRDLAQTLKISLEAEKKKCRLAFVNLFLMGDITVVEILVSVEIPRVSRIEASHGGAWGIFS